MPDDDKKGRGSKPVAKGRKTGPIQESNSRAYRQYMTYEVYQHNPLPRSSKKVVPVKHSNRDTKVSQSRSTSGKAGSRPPTSRAASQAKSAIPTSRTSRRSASNQGRPLSTQFSKSQTVRAKRPPSSAGAQAAASSYRSSRSNIGGIAGNVGRGGGGRFGGGGGADKIKGR